jgi:hypothetical protein
MGRDLSFRLEGETWSDVPTASRNNEVLGYIHRSFTKRELEEYIGVLIQETKSYDYNMNDIANAIGSLEYILSKMHSNSCVVHIRYQ